MKADRFKRLGYAINHKKAVQEIKKCIYSPYRLFFKEEQINLTKSMYEKSSMLSKKWRSLPKSTIQNYNDRALTKTKHLLSGKLKSILSLLQPSNSDPKISKFSKSILVEYFDLPKEPKSPLIKFICDTKSQDNSADAKAISKKWKDLDPELKKSYIDGFNYEYEEYKEKYNEQMKYLEILSKVK